MNPHLSGDQRSKRQPGKETLKEESEAKKAYKEEKRPEQAEEEKQDKNTEGKNTGTPGWSNTTTL